MDREIRKCRYSGDEEDEFCANCDGLTVILEDGTEVPANDCGGYSVDFNETPVPTSNINEQSPLSTLTEPAEPRETVQNTPSGTMGPLNNPTGVTIEIQAESGVSLEIKNSSGGSTWYKLGYTEKVSVPPNADLESERKALWDRVNNEVDAQVQEVMVLSKSK